MAQPQDFLALGLHTEISKTCLMLSTQMVNISSYNFSATLLFTCPLDNYCNIAGNGQVSFSEVNNVALDDSLPAIDTVLFQAYQGDSLGSLI